MALEVAQVNPKIPQVGPNCLVKSNKSACSLKPRIFADVPPLVSACPNIIFEGAKESTLLKFSQFLQFAFFNISISAITAMIRALIASNALDLPM